MQARFYAPMYGRFLSPDPARDQHFEETQSWNIYSYVENQPTMKIDPDGMAPTDPGGSEPSYYYDHHDRKGVHYHKVRPGSPVKRAEVIMGEVGGVKPLEDKDGNPDPKSAADLKQAMTDVAQAAENGKEEHTEANGSNATEPGDQEAWELAKDAADDKSSIPATVIWWITRTAGSKAKSVNVKKGTKGDVRGPFMGPYGNKVEIVLYDKRDRKPPKKPKARKPRAPRKPRHRAGE